MLLRLFVLSRLNPLMMLMAAVVRPRLMNEVLVQDGAQVKLWVTDHAIGSRKSLNSRWNHTRSEEAPLKHGCGSSADGYRALPSLRV